MILQDSCTGSEYAVAKMGTRPQPKNVVKRSNPPRLADLILQTLRARALFCPAAHQLTSVEKVSPRTLRPLPERCTSHTSPAPARRAILRHPLYPLTHTPRLIHAEYLPDRARPLRPVSDRSPQLPHRAARPPQASMLRGVCPPRAEAHTPVLPAARFADTALPPLHSGAATPPGSRCHALPVLDRKAPRRERDGPLLPQRYAPPSRRLHVSPPRVPLRAPYNRLQTALGKS